LSRPRWTRLYHFTHIDHLASILHDGLVADSTARCDGLLQHEAGGLKIKERRRRTHVPVGAGGVVADYVPFYFAPRSPMLFRIFKDGVTTYDGDQADLIYLCSTIERLDELGLTAVVTDRNAAVRVAAFSDDTAAWGAVGFVDWDLMEARYWTGTEDYPDRMERRMAECLVHGRVPWEAILAIGTMDDEHAGMVGKILDDVADPPKVVVRPEWYF
jgi:hypothetical protein